MNYLMTIFSASTWLCTNPTQWQFSWEAKDLQSDVACSLKTSAGQTDRSLFNEPEKQPNSEILYHHASPYSCTPLHVSSHFSERLSVVSSVDSALLLPWNTLPKRRLRLKYSPYENERSQRSFHQQNMVVCLARGFWTRAFPEFGKYSAYHDWWFCGMGDNEVFW